MSSCFDSSDPHSCPVLGSTKTPRERSETGGRRKEEEGRRKEEAEEEEDEAEEEEEREREREREKGVGGREGHLQRHLETPPDPLPGHWTPWTHRTRITGDF